MGVPRPLGLLALLGAGLAACSADPAEHPYYAGAPEGRTEIIAHAGGKDLAPENTLVAFALAEKMGADVLEGDVHLTKDGIVVVIHDETIDRTTDKAGRVADMTYAELELADAGAQFAVDGVRLFAQSGVRVPKLSEALRGHPGRWIVEIKPDGETAALAVCGVVREAGAEARVLVASFHGRAMAAFRRTCPAVATSLSGPEARNFYILSRVYLGFLARGAGLALQIPEWDGDRRVLDERLLAAARGNGLKVEVWTVNERADMDRLIRLGVDGIMTDRVDRMQEALAAVGMAKP